jgi:hypothetical protein
MIAIQAGSKTTYYVVSYCITNQECRTKEVNNMKFNKKRLGLLLLGIWLIMTGLLQVVSVPIPAIGKILAVLAIAAGALIVLDR